MNGDHTFGAQEVIDLELFLQQLKTKDAIIRPEAPLLPEASAEGDKGEVVLQVAREHFLLVIIRRDARAVLHSLSTLESLRGNRPQSSGLRYDPKRNTPLRPEQVSTASITASGCENFVFW